MWVLCDQDTGKEYYLFYGKELTIAREGDGHIIYNHRTISRVHASLYIDQDEDVSNPNKLSRVILKDLKSTNGTYINSCIESNTRIEPNKPQVLNDGDYIRFGRNFKCKLSYKPLIITPSQITSKATKEKLKEILKCVGGHLVKEWTEGCSILVMNNLFLTAKAVSALAAGAHIVTPSYFPSLLDAITNKKDLPNPGDFLPALKEPSLNGSEVSFIPISQRKNLFCGKIFFFQNESSMKRMKTSILLSGGKCELLSAANYREILSENCVLIKSSAETSVPEFQNALDILNKDGKTAIPESDIGLAIVHSSTEKYCNPRFNISGILQPNRSQSQMFQNMMIYATETQTQNEPPSSLTISLTTVPESGQQTKSKQGKCDDVKDSEKKRCEMEVISIDDHVSSLPSTLTEQCNSLKDEDKENVSKRKRPPSFTESPGKNMKKQACISYEMSEQEKLEVEGKRKCDERDDDGFIYPSPLKKSASHRPPPLEKGRELPQTPHDDISLDVDRSIPFNPYTLPSIDPTSFGCNDDEDDPTEIEEDKENHKDDDHRVMETPLKATPPSQVQRARGADDTWFGKPQVRMEPVRASTIKHEVLSRVSEPPPCNPPQKEEENEFALPFRTQRKRRKERKSAEGPNEENLQPDPKRIKQEVDDQPDAHKDWNSLEASQHETKEFPPLNCTSTAGPGSPKDIRVKAEEDEDEDVSDLDRKFKESLIVVEYHYLIKTNANQSVEVPERSYGEGFKNFKRFKKVLPGVSSDGIDDLQVLPRIIGGSDLVVADRVNNRIDSFLATQSDLVAELDKREERREQEKNDNFDPDFNLIASNRPRKRGRLFL